MKPSQTQPRTCTIRGCQEPRLARGWCNTHYRRWRRHGDPRAGLQHRTDCRVTDCPRKHCAKGLCAMHYQRWKRHGDPEWTPLLEVDEVAVKRTVRGERPGRLTTGERREVVRRLHLQRMTDGQIAAHLDIGDTAVQQIRTLLGLPAVTSGRKAVRHVA